MVTTNWKHLMKMAASFDFTYWKSPRDTKYYWNRIPEAALSLYPVIGVSGVTKSSGSLYPPYVYADKSSSSVPPSAPDHRVYLSPFYQCEGIISTSTDYRSASFPITFGMLGYDTATLTEDMYTINHGFVGTCSTDAPKIGGYAAITFTSNSPTPQTVNCFSTWMWWGDDMTEGEDYYHSGNCTKYLLSAYYFEPVTL